MSLHGWLNIKVFIGLCLLFTCSLASAAIQLQQTRLVYPAGEPSVALVIKNSDAIHSVAIESWVESEQGEMTITPSTTLIKPATNGVLNIHIPASGKSNNKESLYWLNIKGTQLEKPGSPEPLTIAIINRIKVFYRPKTLLSGSADAYKKLIVSTCRKQLIIKNPTPYYVSFYSFKVDDKEVMHIQMIKPYGELLAPLPASGRHSMASWQTISDTGFRSSPLLMKINTRC